MITVSQYLSFIFNEITRARVIADTESLRIAEEYAKSPLMKYFSVPRFKIPELEVNVPMVIAGAQYNNVYMFTWQRADFDKTMIGFINQFSNQFAKPFVFDSPQMAQVKREVDDFYNDLLDMSQIQDLSQLQSDKRTQVNQNIDFIVKLLLAVYNGQERAKPGILPFTRIVRVMTQDEIITSWKSAVSKMVVENIRLRESVLKNLLISPETNVVKTEATEISIFSVKAKITEEGIFINSVKSDDGSETKVVDFE